MRIDTKNGQYGSSVRSPVAVPCVLWNVLGVIGGTNSGKEPLAKKNPDISDVCQENAIETGPRLRHMACMESWSIGPIILTDTPTRNTNIAKGRVTQNLDAVHEKATESVKRKKPIGLAKRIRIFLWCIIFLEHLISEVGPVNNKFQYLQEPYTTKKIWPVGADGRKARILLTLNAALEIKDKLKDLIDVLDGVLKKEEASTERSEDKPEEESKFSEAANNDGLIKSHIVNYPYRRYFLDLKRNKRGHFLRLTMLSTLNRVQLAVPSQGMLDLYNAINDLLDKWWDGSEAETQKESKSLRVDNRTLYFDSSCNRYGTYLRISEVRTASRTAITIPSRALSRFRDIINGLAADLENVKRRITRVNPVLLQMVILHPSKMNGKRKPLYLPLMPLMNKCKFHTRTVYFSGRCPTAKSTWSQIFSRSANLIASRKAIPSTSDGDGARRSLKHRIIRSLKNDTTLVNFECFRCRQQLHPISADSVNRSDKD
ncbi:transcriptional activator protein Pur-alpha [Clonorchis sinensis]|uniref:Transcriptional activator protein Pur-alpha n=1 Tax=Clonorchis sinensis TaxID=79923 RepID=G7YKJ6_CLOSI|nr:transcriptional activator protein Pur-alpha [Clonorchis sinensis]